MLTLRSGPRSLLWQRAADGPNKQDWTVSSVSEVAVHSSKLICVCNFVHDTHRLLGGDSNALFGRQLTRNHAVERGTVTMARGPIRATCD